MLTVRLAIEREKKRIDRSKAISDYGRVSHETDSVLKDNNRAFDEIATLLRNDPKKQEMERIIDMYDQIDKAGNTALRRRNKTASSKCDIEMCDGRAVQRAVFP